jgi:hypothetical protein
MWGSHDLLAVGTTHRRVANSTPQRMLIATLKVCGDAEMINIHRRHQKNIVL